LQYEPSDDDVVWAPLRSVRVQGSPLLDQGREWIIYDLECTTPSRPSWAPFSGDVNVILFFTPVSCFHEQLREDRSVNRLADSIQLWRTVCSSPILAETQIILFLNKCHIPRNKLHRGVLLKIYVPSLRHRNDDAVTALTYFQHRFREIFKACSSQRRPFFVYRTSAVVSHLRTYL
ncbi:guanine nucleotide binding protein, alpha subunit, partial [Pisolithus marmoratus]